MKIRKASLADILSYVLMFSLFTAFLVSTIFNNITEERRSLAVDRINQVAMKLQADLEGYSINPSYTYMYDNGGLISEGAAISKKNVAINDAKKAIEDYFNESRTATQLTLDEVNIDIIDGGRPKDSAKIKIVVKYNASFRSPYSKESADKANSNGFMNVSLEDSVERIIENPKRQKNI